MGQKVKELAVTFELSSCSNFNSCLTGHSNKLVLGGHSVLTLTTVSVNITIRILWFLRIF